MTDGRSTRRRFLRASGLLGAGALAGCSSTFNERVGATPPAVESPSTVEQLERVNIVTTFDGSRVPEYWSIAGGPAESATVSRDAARAGVTSLGLRLGDADQRLLGISTAPTGMPLQDGDRFFTWLYVPTTDLIAEFGLRGSFETDDGYLLIGAPTVRLSYGTVSGSTFGDGDDLTESTLGTDVSGDQWLRFGITVYPSSDEVRFSLVEDGQFKRTDRLSFGAELAETYRIYAYGRHNVDTETRIYLDRITAGPYRKRTGVPTPAGADQTSGAGGGDGTPSER